jgi:septal ring-binding cell division protein DamX
VIVPEIQCQLHYSAKLDRIIGGDFFREIGGKAARSVLMPSERAKSLAADAKQLDAAYREAFPDERAPFPMVIAVITVPAFPAEVDGQQQMVPIEDLFRLTQLASAPQEFRDLAQAIVIPPDTVTVLDQMPVGTAGCATFTTQLFNIIRCGHRSAFTFSRAGGCTLAPDSVGPAGKLNDLYFLTHLPSASNAAELAAKQRNDLMNALATVATVGAEADVPLEELFQNAAKTYAGSMPATLAASVTKTARALDGRSVASRDNAEAAGELADAMMNARSVN